MSLCRFDYHVSVAANGASFPIQWVKTPETMKQRLRDDLDRKTQYYQQQLQSLAEQKSKITAELEAADRRESTLVMSCTTQSSLWKRSFLCRKPHCLHRHSRRSRETFRRRVSSCQTSRKIKDSIRKVQDRNPEREELSGDGQRCIIRSILQSLNRICGAVPNSSNTWA